MQESSTNHFGQTATWQRSGQGRTYISSDVEARIREIVRESLAAVFHGYVIKDVYNDMKKTFVTVTIPGRPVAKGRPRLGRHGVYTPKTTSDAEESLQWALREACPVPLEGPLELSVRFCFRYPKSWRKAARDAVENGAEPWYMGRPDLDNLLKLLTDAGNGILWKDDAQVVEVKAMKMYSVEDQTVVFAKVVTSDGNPSDGWMHGGFG